MSQNEKERSIEAKVRRRGSQRDSGWADMQYLDFVSAEET